MSAPLANLRTRLRPLNGVLVDSNILIDVATCDPAWAAWSERALADCADHAQLIIDPLIYAEVSLSYASIESLETSLPASIYQREPLPWEAGFLAAKCFQLYRRRGGQRSSTLPDFFIGAHAAVRGLAILTRDAARYRTYFPTLTVLAPATR